MIRIDVSNFKVCAILEPVGSLNTDILEPIKGMKNQEKEHDNAGRVAACIESKLIQRVSDKMKEMPNSMATCPDPAKLGAGSFVASCLHKDKQKMQKQVRAILEKEQQIKEARQADRWDPMLLNPEGLLGEVVKFIIEASGMHQPKFALAAAITVCGALLGRAVKDWTGQRTNIYTLALGPTSAGKDSPIKCVQRLLMAMGRHDKLLAGEITSDSALFKMIEVFQVRLLLIDEIGHYLDQVKKSGNGSGSHLRSVMPMLTKSWSAASGALQSKTKAPDTNGHWTPPRFIDHPCICIYGTSVPDIVFDNIQKRDLTDGSIPRFVPFISNTRPKHQPKRDIAVDKELVDKLNDALLLFGLSEATYRADDPAEFPPVMTITETEEARIIFDQFEDYKDEMLRQADDDSSKYVLYLYGKCVENARRVALIVACFRNPQMPEVDGYAAGYAVKLMKATIGDMVDAVSENSVTPYERQKKEMLRIIRKAGAEGIDGSKLCRKTQWARADLRKHLLDDLEESKQVLVVTDNSASVKGVTTYYYLGDQDVQEIQ